MKKIREEQPELVEEELGEEKKKTREEKAAKRRQIKKQDQLARWSGLMLLVVVMMIGFVLWVVGEMGEEAIKPIPVQERAPIVNPSSRVIIE